MGNHTEKTTAHMRKALAETTHARDWPVESYIALPCCAQFSVRGRITMAVEGVK